MRVGDTVLFRYDDATTYPAIITQNGDDAGYSNDVWGLTVLRWRAVEWKWSSVGNAINQFKPLPPLPSVK